MEYSLTTFFVVALLHVLAVLLYCIYINWPDKNLPPQVPGSLLWGNVGQVPFTSAGNWLKELADKHGEMFTLRLGSQTWVYLNTSKVVDDLLEKRSAIYSSRVEFPVASTLMSGGYRMLMMPYNDRWRRIRKTMHQILNTRQADKFKIYQDIQSRKLIRFYLRSPDKWYFANQAFANSVILSVVFGRDSSPGDADLQELLFCSAAFLRNFKPGANLADSFPWLSYLPRVMQWWRPGALALFERTKACYQKEIDKVKEKMEQGTAEPCFATDWLRSNEDDKDRPIDWEVESLFVFGTLMEAGSDTSRVAIGQAIAAAAIYPQWVEKARAELDSFYGADASRLPSLDDRSKLPYISAVVKETLRWRPFIQAGVSRMLIRDDEYKGYKFPKGTVFSWNPWAISLNPAEYENPMEFIPDRFMNDDVDSPLKGHWSFGAGRRVCAGYNVGFTNVWIAVARLIYCFDFFQTPGNPIDTMHSNWMQFDGPAFSVQIKLRSQRHAELIERECPN